jgi:hypothetical protein
VVVGGPRQQVLRPSALEAPELEESLMHRALGLDVLVCPRCGGRLRVVAPFRIPPSSAPSWLTSPPQRRPTSPAPPRPRPTIPLSPRKLPRHPAHHGDPVAAGIPPPRPRPAPLCRPPSLPDSLRTHPGILRPQRHPFRLLYDPHAGADARPAVPPPRSRSARRSAAWR